MELSSQQATTEHRNGGCFLIGSGPSLNSIDIKKLCRYDSIAFNRAYIAFQQWGFFPDYYACFDPLVIADNIEDLKNLAGYAQIRKLFFADSVARYGMAPSERVNLLRLQIKGPFSASLSAVVDLGNVAASSLQVLAALGYKKIAMVGVDGRYKLSPGVATDQEGIMQVTLDVDHFAPEYGTGKRRQTRPDMQSIVGAWSRAAPACKACGLDVRNASPSSAIDCFERISFEEALRWIEPKGWS